MKHRSRGFTLIELMVAVGIASLTVLVVLQVLSTFQSRKQTVTGSNDAEINASLGMYAIEREVRMAGAGYTSAVGIRCTAGINIYHDGVTLSDRAPLMPVRIIDGGAGAPDAIEILRSDANVGVAPAMVMQAMPTAASSIVVDSDAAFANNDIILAVSNDDSLPCTMMQLTAAPLASGANWALNHASTSPYNPADPTSVFTQAANYQPRDSVVNLGTFGLRRFEVICSDGGAPLATNNCDLKWFDPAVMAGGQDINNTESVVSQVIDLQAQYGVAPAGSQNVDQWVDADAAPWNNPTNVDIARIKALRVSIVTRANREGGAVAPASLVLWDEGEATERLRALTADERRYRYQVLTVVVPLINIIWSGI